MICMLSKEINSVSKRASKIKEEHTQTPIILQWFGAHLAPTSTPQASPWEFHYNQPRLQQVCFPGSQTKPLQLFSGLTINPVGFEGSPTKPKANQPRFTYPSFNPMKLGTKLIKKIRILSTRPNSHNTINETLKALCNGRELVLRKPLKLLMLLEDLNALLSLD